MNFEILANGYESIPEQWKAPWSKFFQDAATSIGMSAEDLENVLVADKANYGSAIARLDGGSYTSSDSGGVTYGKTVSRLTEDNRVKCSIVLSLETFEQIRIAIAKPSDQRNAAEQFYIYVLFHELGHCVDDVTRKDLLDIKSDPISPFDPTKLAADNTHIIRGEYAACGFAANNMTTELYRFLESGFVTEWNNVIRWFEEPGHELMQRAGAIWVQMSEYAKLAGHRAGNSELHSTIDLGSFGGLFLEWENVLTEDWKKYPNWSEFPNSYKEIWLKFCGKFLVTF